MQRQRSHTGSRTVAEDSPETELLLRCSLPPSVSRDTARIRTLLREELSWERILDLGGRHSILPVLFRHIDAAPDHEVPEAVVDQLRNRTQSRTVRNLQYAEELHAIVRRFENRSIRALPFKGPVLAEHTYGDLAMRAFGDLDILVYRADISAAVDALEDRGYEWVEAAPRLDDSPLLGGQLTRPMICEYELERGNHTVEIRWRVGESELPFGIEFERMWERRDTAAVAGVSLPALDPEDRLLMLAYHGTKHNWCLLKWVADFAVAVERTAVEWQRLFRRAKAHGLERKLLLGIALVNGLYGISVPEQVRKRLREDDRAETLAARIETELETPPPERPTSMERLALNARATDSRRDIARMLLQRGRLHPSLFEYKLLPLPGEFHPLYYPVVPIRLAAERLASAIR